MSDRVRLEHERLDVEWFEATERDGLVEAPPGGGGGSSPVAPPLSSRLDGTRVKGHRPVPAKRVDTGGEAASGGPERDRPMGSTPVRQLMSPLLSRAAAGCEHRARRGSLDERGR